MSPLSIFPRRSPKNGSASGTARDALSAAPKGPAYVLRLDHADCANAQSRSARPYGVNPTSPRTIEVSSRPYPANDQTFTGVFNRGGITAVGGSSPAHGGQARAFSS